MDNWFIKATTSSTGKKLLMATTGLFLIIFLLAHLYGNLLILKWDNGTAFNAYSEALLTNVIIRLVEVILTASLLIHIPTGIILALQNAKARPVRYKMKNNNSSSWSSRNMKFTGGLVLIFLAIHLSDLFYKHRIAGTDETMYASTIALFQNQKYVITYIIFMAALALHLTHGFYSAFQTLGLKHNKYNLMIKITTLALAVLIPTGFAIIPAAVYLKMQP